MVVISSCHQNRKCGDLTLLFCRGRHGNGYTLHAAWAAPLFPLNHLIKFLIFGFVVAVPVVYDKAPWFQFVFLEDESKVYLFDDFSLVLETLSWIGIEHA